MPAFSKKLREYGTVLNISLPLMAYYFSETAIGLTDLYIVGQLGALELAAVGLGRTLVFGWLMMGFCVLSMVSVLCSEARASGQPDRMRETLVQGFWLANLIALAGVGGMYSVPALLAFLGYEAAMQEAVADYLRWVSWMMIPGLWFALLRNFLSVLNRARIFLLVSIGAVVVNYLLNQMLVFGRLGFPALGIRGAGLATVLVNLISMVVLFIYAYAIEPARVRSILGSLWQVRPRAFGTLIRLGLPAGAMQLLESGFFILISILMGLFGAAWLAAHNVMLAVLEVNFVIALSMGEALSIRLAYQNSLNRPVLVREMVSFGYLVTGLVTLAMIALLVFSPEWVITRFMSPLAPGYEETLQNALVLAGLTAAFLLFDSAQVLSTWMLRGFRDTLVPMLIGTGGYWGVGLGMGALLSFVLDVGAVGLWWGFALGLTTAGVLLIARVVRQAKQ